MKITKQNEDLFFPEGTSIKEVWESLKELRHLGIDMFAEFDPTTQKISMNITEGPENCLTCSVGPTLPTYSVEENVIYIQKWRK